MADVDHLREATRKQARQLLPAAIDRIDWPRARLDEHRERSLRTLLRHLLERSPWHRDRLGGIDAATFRIEDLARLPTMSKADLMAGFDAIATDPRVTLARCEEHIDSGELLMDGRFLVLASSGSSGMRAVNVTVPDLLAECWVGGMTRFVWRWARRTCAWASPTPPVVIGAGPGPHGSHVLTQFFGSQEAMLCVADPLDDIIDALNAANPQHLVVYASFIPRLLDQAHRGRLRIRPKLLSPVAEPFLPEHALAVADTWDCGVIVGWGATETTSLGAGSGFEPGMLLLDDLAIIEPVDTNERPVQPGQRADKLFVTPLLPGIVPVLRYELTDQLTVLEGPAACGTSFTPVSNVSGRLDEEFVYHEGMAVHPHVFRSVLGKRGAITDYQVQQTGRGAIVRVVLAAGRHDDLDADEMTREIRGRLTRLGLLDPEIHVEAVREVPRTRVSGKLQRFVPKRPGASSSQDGIAADA